MKFQFSKAAFAAAQEAREAAIAKVYGAMANDVANAVKASLEQSQVAVSLASDAIAKRDSATKALWTGYGKILDQVRADCDGKTPQEAEVIVGSAINYVASIVPEAPKGSTPAQYTTRFRTAAKYFTLGEHWTTTLEKSDKTAKIAKAKAAEISYQDMTDAIKVMRDAEKDKELVLLENLSAQLSDAIKLAIRGKAAKKATDKTPASDAIKAVKADVLHKQLSASIKEFRELTRLAQLAVSDMQEESSEETDLEAATRPDHEGKDDGMTAPAHSAAA